MARIKNTRFLVFITFIPSLFIQQKPPAKRVEHDFLVIQASEIAGLPGTPPGRYGAVALSERSVSSMI